jgi:hypothetical protein
VRLPRPVRQRQHVETGAGDPEQHEVRVRVVGHEVRDGGVRPVRQLDADRRGAPGHVRARNEQPVGGDEEAGRRRGPHALEVDADEPHG